MTSTQTHGPALDSTQLYNLIMGGIEPELTTDMLPMLADIYADETPEQRKERASWYAIAFDIFEEKKKIFVEGWKNYYKNLRNQATEFAQKVQTEDDSTAADSISDSIEHS